MSCWLLLAPTRNEFVHAALHQERCPEIANNKSNAFYCHMLVSMDRLSACQELKTAADRTFQQWASEHVPRHINLANLRRAASCVAYVFCVLPWLRQPNRVRPFSQPA